VAKSSKIIKLKKEEEELRSKIWKFWKSIDVKLLEKFKNINGKTGRYDVPNELFQKRTSRTNRVLFRWKLIKENEINLQHLNSFFGGVCVELVNDDYFNKSNEPILKSLKKIVGGNGLISSMISLRNEDGTSNSTLQRNLFKDYKIEKNKGFPIIKRNQDAKVKFSGKGENNVWQGKIYYSIRGGEQDTFESHPSDKLHPMLFNPALEYANERVCFDIDMTMSYFALHCNDIDKDKNEINSLKSEIEIYLNDRVYFETKLKNNNTIKINLLDYCKNHYSLKWGKGFLIDPIQMVKMSIDDFKTSNTRNSSVVSHNESADKAIFYYDSKQEFILSPARPTNLFWSKHHSNMMQQDYNLEDYFAAEKDRYKKRIKFFKK